MELTRILDTLKDADGNPAVGKLVIQNPAFIASDGTAVVGGRITYLISTTSPGLVDLLLAPTEGADPSGVVYRVEYFLKNGAAYTELWQVPHTTPVSISQVRS